MDQSWRETFNFYVRLNIRYYLENNSLKMEFNTQQKLGSLLRFKTNDNK